MRYEIKIPINVLDLNEFYSWKFRTKTLRKTFEDRIVNSIYYDNEDLLLAKHNISGISERHKFRIRWYGDNEDSKFFYELKIKKNKFGKKIIVPSIFNWKVHVCFLNADHPLPLRPNT